MKAVIRLKSFPDHRGIPGHQGGSLPEHAFPIDIHDAGKEDVITHAIGGTWPTVDSDHYYHATRLSNLEGIRANGLQPTKQGTFTGYSHGKDVSLTTGDSGNVEYWTGMAAWAAYDKSGHTAVPYMTVLRVKKSDVTNPTSYRSDEFNTASIASDKLEYWTGKTWESL
jgi:hypothetical protein